MDDFTALLRLVLQETGGNQNVWGDILNASLIRLLDDAIAGREDVDVSLSDQTLMGQNGADDPARAAILIVQGNPGVEREVIVPSTSKIYIVSNETSPGFDVTVKTALGSGAIVAPGERRTLYVDDDLDDVVKVNEVPQATETVQGIAEIADQAEVDAGTDDERFVTPLKLTAFPAVNQATEDIAGVAEIATQVETDAGVLDDKIVSPLKLEGRQSTTLLTGLARRATQGEVDTGTEAAAFVTPETLSSTLSGVLSFFEGTSTITGLTAGKTYLVNVYGHIFCRGNDAATDQGIIVRNGVSVGSGTLLNETGSISINWPDGEAPTSAGLIVVTTGTSINGVTDTVAAEYMSAVQLD
jgi:hypothetical protein